MSAFNPERLVTLGEGLAAGFGPFSLQRTSQRFSFPALVAQQLDVAFPQPLFEPPGVGNAPGFEPQPVIAPGVAQCTLFDSLPPVEFANLSVPGWTLRDALERRPTQPMIARGDAKQTAGNLILGARRIATNRPLLTQAELAGEYRATGAIVALGFTEVLEFAISGGLTELPTADQFGEMYRRLLSALSPATCLVLTVPDPLNTAFFLTPAGAAQVLRVEETWLREAYSVSTGQFLKLPAIHEIGYQIFGKRIAPLLPHALLSADFAQVVSDRVRGYNRKISEAAAAHQAHLCDLHALTRRLAAEGCDADDKHLSADYLGGIYSLNGYYPGHAGHCIIANEILKLLGEPPLDLGETVANDPNANVVTAAGRTWLGTELSSFQPATPRTTKIGLTRRANALQQLKAFDYSALPQKLRLPESLTQELPLEPFGSYFGDGIAANHCEDPVDAQFGDGGHFLFGGLAMVDSHLRGTLRFEFTPITQDRASFRLRFDELQGDDAILAAPILFRMAFQRTGVSSYPSPYDVSTGEVDLTTGLASKLRVYASFRATALETLVRCNPHFPATPLSFVTLDVAESPLEYSSAWGRFEQRDDGRLDFTFYGTRFVPLGPGARWPLNFSGPDGDITTIPASGTVMHPHLRLTTKKTPSLPIDDAPPGGACTLLPLPENCVREFTFHTHNTAFGDGFDLRVPELGGPSTGRAHVLGRCSAQFGLESGGTIPVAIRNLPPGGIFSQPPPSPISDSFPARVAPGPRGFDQRLRYPRATFTMEDISIPDDPFDVALGAVDVETGYLFTEHLHRGFIQQDVINAVMRLEPRVRHSSFFFRGPALFTMTRSNALMFRFFGDEILSYFAGLAYPRPDFTHAYYAGLGATLNPYFWIRAIEDSNQPDLVAEGSFRNLTAAAGRDDFSLDYRIPASPGSRDFHFTLKNSTQLGSFELHGLSWVGFGMSANTSPAAGYDTLTFSGFGVWEKNTVRSLEQIAVQIWNNPESPQTPYIGIQIALGVISNLDTRPTDPNDARP